MKKLGDLLSRFKDLTPPHDAVKVAIVEAVRDVADISLAKKDVQIARGTAFILSSSIVKSMIAVNRAKILESLYTHLPKSRESVRDIR